MEWVTPKAKKWGKPNLVHNRNFKKHHKLDKNVEWLGGQIIKHSPLGPHNTLNMHNAN
jgi:hypothetical protein